LCDTHRHQVRVLGLAFCVGMSANHVEACMACMCGYICVATGHTLLSTHTLSHIVTQCHTVSHSVSHSPLLAEEVPGNLPRSYQLSAAAAADKLIKAGYWPGSPTLLLLLLLLSDTPATPFACDCCPATAPSPACCFGTSLPLPLLLLLLLSGGPYRSRTALAPASAAAWVLARISPSAWPTCVTWV
jgi:hypothetical protein